MDRRTVRHALVGYAFLLPNIIGFISFTLGPILFTFVISFLDWNLFSRPVFVDTANFVALLTHPDSGFWTQAGSTLFFLIVVPLQMVIALAIAYLLDENLKGSVFFKVIFFLPVVLSTVAMSVIWAYLLDTQNGLLNATLGWFGVARIAWLYDPFWTKIGISLMVIWQGSAFSTIIYFAALQGIPDQLYEAAKLDGARRWTRFWRITFPLLGPTHFFLAITGMIGALQIFAPIVVMTHGTAGGAHTLLVEIYWKAYNEFHMGHAAALSWILFLLIFLLSSFTWKSLASRAEQA